MMKPVSLPPGILRNPVHWPALGFGLGAAPFAPGTFGTLLGIPVYLLLADLPLAGYLVAVAVLFLVGIAACHVTARALGVHDHPAIVIDEVVGFLITMMLAPPGGWWLAAGFALFRLFDIWKPWPIRWIDRRVHGGVGIMLDDVLAGVYALLMLQLVARLLE
jgi:phosphatidylglycerophosphatase A